MNEVSDMGGGVSIGMGHNERGKIHGSGTCLALRSIARGPGTCCPGTDGYVLL